MDFQDLAWHPATAAINTNLKGQNKTATVALVPVKVEFPEEIKFQLF